MNLLPIVRNARAEDDLIMIWLHIASDSEAAADRLLDRIEARWQQLATYPFSGAPRDDIAPGVRHLVVGNYLTLYRVRGDAIEILRVLHGHRNFETDDLGS
ncbi:MULTISPECIES: type II toxin-antitoxin system RelE/ParE family toxin [unclassified Mesorhizobium]|uniref:type II toxin-antitoxin system RelE/ParE family toxin n=1 Tax=unclassified Mesorhizobium TaxID=325217 RepID=UPI00112834C8|nr:MULTISPECIES: type II toxin-antitoxin system RelE/ParE family toxin [unclassified Mesorhizobium]MBZ9982911.1 type II toxin-antitoxin system RelE/ParE family toxin [Mesorhizobium sp. BR-1-1-8]TPL15650.1 type II toxin-antitoxin system RelE/ParE family toxin [Mesorhizobium sp. B2-4-9]TPL36423.1 type II toxin-antitoxin system RelE/ParE family toxin [Mesorhizobium sp. B2-4-8]TPL66449.1 type II toxin-antitoxin system RelE/ParE family toxin [Mesorhizobium sp. B2-4-1]